MEHATKAMESLTSNILSFVAMAIGLYVAGIFIALILEQVLGVPARVRTQIAGLLMVGLMYLCFSVGWFPPGR